MTGPGRRTAGVLQVRADGAAVWHAFDDSHKAPRNCSPDGTTRATDPLLLYFTSGTTSKPKLLPHRQQSYPAGQFATMFWIGLRHDDRHLNTSSPGWGEHAWSSFFAPWNISGKIQRNPLRKLVAERVGAPVRHPQGCREEDFAELEGGR